MELLIDRLYAGPLVELLEDAWKAHRISDMILADRPAGVRRDDFVLPVALPKRSRH